MLHTFIVPSDDTSAAALTLSPLIGRRCQLRGLAISGMTHSLAPDVPIDVPETFAKPTTSVPYRTNRTFPVPVAGAASATWDTEFQASFAEVNSLKSCTGVPTVMPLRGMRHRGMSFANALPLRMSPRVYDGSAGVPVVAMWPSCQQRPGIRKAMPISGSTRTCLLNASKSFPPPCSILSSCRLTTPLQPH